MAGAKPWPEGRYMCCVIKGNKSHGFGAMHLKVLIKTNHVQLKLSISCQWFTQKFVLKVGDSGQIAVIVGADMLTR